MEMLIFPSGVGGDGIASLAYSFVVKDNGTLISRFGISYDIDLARNNNIWLTLRRTTRTLNDEEVQTISKLLDIISERYDADQWTVMGAQKGMILYQNSTYDRSGACVDSFDSILNKIIQRSFFVILF